MVLIICIYFTGSKDTAIVLVVSLKRPKHSLLRLSASRERTFVLKYERMDRIETYHPRIVAFKKYLKN